MVILGRINVVLCKIANFLTMIFIAGIAIVIPTEVFNRYVRGQMFTWATEFCQYSFVWASMMGAAAGLKNGGQVAVTTLKEKLEKRNSKKAILILQAIVYIIMMIFFIIMIYYGAIQTIFNFGQISSTIRIPMSFPYAALPLGFLMMFLTTLEQFLILLRDGNSGGN